MNKSDIKRDLYMLKGPLAKKGYDWWWHKFTAYNKKTGKPKGFFIEYYICNPARGKKQPVLGQQQNNKERGIFPSYAMIKVGCWGKNAKQIHNFYSIENFTNHTSKLNIEIGPCTLSETAIKGICRLSELDAQLHPEYMSNYGTMSWDLTVNKKIAYNVGYGASPLFRFLNAFEMFWHAEGMKTEYSGQITFDNEEYEVIPEKSYGYADKNWGSDFTSPWLWISSCNLKSFITGKQLKNSVLEIGGGNPKIYGLSLGKKLLGGLYYEGTSYDYNFSKFWTKSNMIFSFISQDEFNIWTVTAKNRYSRMEIILKCPKNEMIFIQYEAPNGKKRHNHLWNGGTGIGEIKLYHTTKEKQTLIDYIEFKNAGCEYGEYDKK